MTLLKVTFNLDGTGLYYDPVNPIHLDALIHWACTPFFVPKDQRNPARDEPPFGFRLPIRSETVNGVEIYRASALFPEGKTNEELVHWRKKFDVSRMEVTRGSPNLTNGVYREYNQPLPLLLTHRLVGWIESKPKDSRKLLGQVKYLGKKASQGYGKVIGVDIQETDDDFTLWRDGKAQRWIPSTQGQKLVRASPPYWNVCDRARCLDVGESIAITLLNQ